MKIGSEAHKEIPVWSNNSCGFARVVFEEPSEPFVTPNMGERSTGGKPKCERWWRRKLQ